MKPLLWRAPWDLPGLGPLEFPAYSTLLALGFVIAGILALREGERLGIDRNDVIDLVLWMAVWGLVGARVLHVIADGHFKDYVHACTDPTQVLATDAPVETCDEDSDCWDDRARKRGDASWDYYLCDERKGVCHIPRDCFAALKIWRGGLAYYGGFVFAVLYAIRFIRKRRLSLWRTFDLCSPYIALGLFFGRLGCFLNGCCYGKVTDGPLGVVFPRHSEPWQHQLDLGLIARRADALPVYPAQLWQSALNLLTFVALYFVVRPRKRADGQVFAWLLILKAVTRSTVEVWRDDERGVFFGGFVSTSQLISIPLLALGLVLLRRLGARSEGAASASAQTSA